MNFRSARSEGAEKDEIKGRYVLFFNEFNRSTHRKVIFIEKKSCENNFLILFMILINHIHFKDWLLTRKLLDISDHVVRYCTTQGELNAVGTAILQY